MTTGDLTAAAARLAFGTTFGAGFSTVFGRFWMFIKAALLPLLASVLIGLVGFAAMLSVPVLTLPLQLLGLLPFALLGIACCRLALIGRQAGAVPRPLFGRRTWIYFGYTLLFILLLWVPFLALGFGLLGNAVLSFGTDPESINPDSYGVIGLAALLFFPFYLVYLYFITRLSLVFPAVAADQKLGLGGSWRLTRGSAGFKLYAVFIVLAIVLVVVTFAALFLVSGIIGLFWMAPSNVPQNPAEIGLTTVIATSAPTVIFTLLLEYLGFAVMIAALASAYAQLSGWTGPRQEILERFD